MITCDCEYAACGMRTVLATCDNVSEGLPVTDTHYSAC